MSTTKKATLFVCYNAFSRGWAVDEVEVVETRKMFREIPGDGHDSVFGHNAQVQKHLLPCGVGLTRAAAVESRRQGLFSKARRAYAVAEAASSSVGTFSEWAAGDRP